MWSEKGIISEIKVARRNVKGEIMDKIIKNMPFYKELAIISPNDLVDYEQYKYSNDFSSGLIISST